MWSRVRRGRRLRRWLHGESLWLRPPAAKVCGSLLEASQPLPCRSCEHELDILRSHDVYHCLERVVQVSVDGMSVDPPCVIHFW